MVLTRKLGEKIYIGTDVVLTVVDIDRNKVRLGVEAPKDVKILREELGVPSDGKENPEAKTGPGSPPF